MVGVLIRMKLAVLRRSFTGNKALELVWGVSFGLAAIIITFVASTLEGTLVVRSDIIALVFMLWGLGWALGPTLFGGEDKTLLPEHFRSLPVSIRKLAINLFGASFVGAPAIISFVAFAAFVVYGLQFGLGAGLIGVAALVCQLLFTILLSRVITNVLHSLTTSHIMALLSSIVTAAIVAFFVTGWWLLGSLEAIITNGLPQTASTLVHLLPTGWGITAIDAARDGQWALTAGLLVGLLLLSFFLLQIWTKQLEIRLTVKRTKHHAISRKKKTSALFLSQKRSVIRKEFLSWTRDYTRSGYLYFAFFYSVILCLYPLATGTTLLLPFAGILFALTAAGSTANTYAADGTALWMTLTAPRALRVDVRGRQLAWLIVVAPVAILLTIIMTLFSGFGGIAWPIVLSLTAATIGAAAGVFVLTSVMRLLPMTDPNKRGDDSFEHGIDWLQFMLTSVLVVALISPTIAIAVAAAYQQSELLQWAGVLVGIGTGVLWAWLLGLLAYKRLEKRGPELFNIMQKGKPAANLMGNGNPDQNPVKQLNIWQQTFFYNAMWIGPVLLFPQGIMPLIFKLINTDAKSWFLALYVEPAWQWPVIAAMIISGLAILGGATYVYFLGAKKVRK